MGRTSKLFLQLTTTPSHTRLLLVADLIREGCQWVGFGRVILFYFFYLIRLNLDKKILINILPDRVTGQSDLIRIKY
jgi:hypothetical protein